MASPWSLREGPSPVVACAVHAGHELRPEVAALTGVDFAAVIRLEGTHGRALDDVAVDVEAGAGAGRLTFPLSRSATWWP